jgi:hypothetical protein
MSDNFRGEKCRVASVAIRRDACLRMVTTTNKYPPGKRPSKLFIPQPEFGDAKDVRVQFGIKGTALYLLWKNGDIKSVVIKAKGRDRGKRLFDYASIRKFLASQEGD